MNQQVMLALRLDEQVYGDVPCELKHIPSEPGRWYGTLVVPEALRPLFADDPHRPRTVELAIPDRNLYLGALELRDYAKHGARARFVYDGSIEVREGLVEAPPAPPSEQPAQQPVLQQPEGAGADAPQNGDAAGAIGAGEPTDLERELQTGETANRQSND